MGKQNKLLIVTDDATQAEDLRLKVSKDFPQTEHITVSEVRREIARLQPDIILICDSKDGTGVVQLLPYISKEVPEALAIYLTENHDPIRTRDMHRAGIFDVLFLPDEINALEDVLTRAVRAQQKRAESKDEIEASFSWANGQVVAFYSGKGGSGRSLIASTLAQTIGLDSNNSVLLVDLNLQYGGIETYLRTEGSRTLHDLTPVLQELNDNHIRSVTQVEPRSQVEVLPSPADAEIAEQITEEHVVRLLRTARLYYDYILVDLPTEMTLLNHAVLEEADHILYTMIPDALSMRVLGTVLDLFSKLSVNPSGRLNIVLNRMSREVELSQKDVSKHFPYPVVATIKDDSKKVQQMLNQGDLIRKSRRERGLPMFARDIQRLARWLLTQQANDHSA